DVLDNGTRVVFHLRPDLAFSDGSPLTAADVVRSWLRVIDPATPSPLASLMDDVVGADDYLHGRSHDPAAVGLKATGPDLEVRLVRPASDFTAIIASPTFGVVPRGGTPDGSVGSGGYTLVSTTSTELTLSANSHYWAGLPAIGTVHLVTSIGGRNPVAAYLSGDLDYAAIGDIDAGWIPYDAILGPDLRAVPSLSTQYLGFDVRQKPFDDIRVRQAFALAVDWQRVVTLASAGATTQPATSLIPPGVPGRPGGDFSEHVDLARARSLLAAAGYPGGAGFPAVTYLTGGTGFDGGILAQLHDALGITIKYESMDFGSFFTRLAVDPPAMWSLGWSADYPGSNDFLGLLLGSGQSNNYGHWQSPAFDTAIGDALAATNPAAVTAAYARAEMIVHDDAPVIPLSYGSGWALSRAGLLGAADSGLGFIRLAGLAWAK
ncbi:MAG TPA: ABC transporter substrate-binding protein, partial [Candidatus Acidoferrum sp.]|nr:ABC transporter substrate-binding protein [Candidatus Acidoferrum sp.]